MKKEFRWDIPRIGDFFTKIGNGLFLLGENTAFWPDFLLIGRGGDGCPNSVIHAWAFIWVLMQGDE